MSLQATVEFQPLVITDNFEELKARLTAEIQRYEIEVTEDNLSDARKMATELNKLGTQLNRVRIDKSKEFAAPIEEFKRKAIELVEIVQNGRTKIMQQVEAFDKRVLAVVEILLTNELEACFQNLNVEPEYRTAQIDDLIVRSNLTRGGALTKAAREKVAERVNADYKVQTTVRARLNTLQSAAERAGLHSLSPDLVAPYLRYNEVDYTEKLAEIIDREIKRQKDLEIKIRLEAEAKIRAEARAEAEAEALAKAKAEQAAQEKTKVPEANVYDMPAEELTSEEAKLAQQEVAEASLRLAGAFMQEFCQKSPLYTVNLCGIITRNLSAADAVEWLDALQVGDSMTMTREV